ncbi:hypothetical protein AMELA_G00109530 [Ameiurus melas]|uniref:Uncharacterized protein n=1 Tax=Ameiurus melas TaxID=219545 RepID=A0A7J6AT80_AMEME|nr:hypothetical protein AMELA_G00109530 [Ameiurus melas]
MRIDTRSNPSPCSAPTECTRLVFGQVTPTSPRTGCAGSCADGEDVKWIKAAGFVLDLSVPRRGTAEEPQGKALVLA